MGQYIFCLSSGIRVRTLWLGLIFAVWSIDSCCHGYKLHEKISYFRYIFFFFLFSIWLSVLENVSLKVFLKAILMIVEKDLSVTRKKLDCLKMKICKRVHLRRVKLKGFIHKWQMRKKTIPTDLSSKYEACFMMKSAFKVMDTCLWYLDSGCSRHITGDCSLFMVFKSKKGGNITFGDRSKSQIEGKGTISLPRLLDITNVLYIEGLRVNLLSISQICDQDFMVLFSKGKCLVLN